MQYLRNVEDSVAIDRIRHLKHHPVWDEAICLALGAMPPEQVAHFVREAILQPESKYEKWLLRDLRLASRCVATHPGQAALRPLRDELALRLLPLVVDADQAETLYYHGGLRERVWEVLLELNSSAFTTALFGYTKSQYADTRLKAAEALVRVGDTRGVVALLALCQEKDDDTDVYRTSATQALGELTASSPQVLTTLLALSLDDDEEINVRSCAIKGLGKLGISSPAVVEALRSLCQANQGFSERIDALHALAALGDEQSIAALVELCPGKEELATFWLNSLPEIEESSSIRLLAAELLGKRGNAYGLAALASLCEHPDVRVYVRITAAEILASQGDPRGTETLIALCDNDDDNVRLSAASALIALGDEHGIATLAQLCAPDRESGDADVR